MDSPAAGLQYRPDEETFFVVLRRVDTASGCVPSSEQYCMLSPQAWVGEGNLGARRCYRL